MRRATASLFVVGILSLTCWLAPAMAEEAPSFDAWVQDLRRDAKARGIRDDILDKALADLAPIERVIELDRKQPEFLQTFWNYLDKRVTDTRIQRSRALLKTHADLFDKIEKKFGVQPRFLVAFWGLETNFGDYTGSFPLYSALATLAQDERRGAFFREQLIAALQIFQAGHITADAKASWAGALGQCQFIPTTYRDFAVDFDGDGKADLWNSLPDIFASAANYLSKSGWKGDEAWGREVKLPNTFDWDLSGLDTRKSLTEWQALGVRRMDGKDLPTIDMQASLVLPSGHSGPAFLVYQNFRTIMVWNRSISYAIAVGHLADRAAGMGGLLSAKPKTERALSYDEVRELQRLLTAQGFDTGGTDGVAGPATRKAAKGFQKKIGMPADGFVDYALLQALEKASSAVAGSPIKQ